MARIVVAQAAVSKPVRVAVAGIGTAWQTIIAANDFSVPDPQVEYPADVDPDRANRRIQPGVAMVEAPLMLHNTSEDDCWVEIRILTEMQSVLVEGVPTDMEVSVLQGHITIPAGNTYTHPAPGQRLLKLSKATANGDRMQVRAQTAGVVHLTAAASEGASEQHQPGAV